VDFFGFLHRKWVFFDRKRVFLRVILCIFEVYSSEIGDFEG
jgi:hypothetical protein